MLAIALCKAAVTLASFEYPFDKVVMRSPPVQKKASLSAETPFAARVFQARSTPQVVVPRYSIHDIAVEAPTERALHRNRTGLPDRLKAGIEVLSGISMDDIRVHRHSPRPKSLGAFAFAQGSAIHLASGQERHLPHEAWHVVQQKQGRVRPTTRLGGGIAINDHRGLEREADVMGARAIGAAPGLRSAAAGDPEPIAIGLPVLQGVFLGGASGSMTDVEFDAALSAHDRFNDLDDDMIRAIRQRHGQARGYNLHNAITSYADGRVEPPAPSNSADQTKKSRRVVAGYVNPPHMSASVIGLYRNAATTPIPHPSLRSERDFLESPSRHFRTFTPTHTQPPVIVQGHAETVMGHGPVDAVDDWNVDGHKRTRAENLAHNRDAAIYHGLEERHASARSGGNTTSRYRSPTPSEGSHESYYRRDHPDFDPAVPWHTYANAADVQSRTRYVPPPLSSSAPPMQGLAQPVPMHVTSQTAQPTSYQMPQFHSPQPQPAMHLPFAASSSSLGGFFSAPVTAFAAQPSTAFQYMPMASAFHAVSSNYAQTGQPMPSFASSATTFVPQQNMVQHPFGMVMPFHAPQHQMQQQVQWGANGTAQTWGSHGLSPPKSKPTDQEDQDEDML